MNPKSLGLLALVVVCTLLPATPILAQSDASVAANAGAWWSASVAYGGARLTCDICDPTRDAGPAIEMAIGAYASPAVRVGLEAGGWTFLEGDFRETVLTAGVVAEVHPRQDSGLHLIGGMGWTGYRANDVDAVDDEGFRYDALRVRLGVGWDLPLTRNWVVGNRVTLDSSSFGTLKDEDTDVDNRVGLSLVRFGIYIRRR